MAYKSDLTGIRIVNVNAMVTVTIWDAILGKVVERYLKDIDQLKEWWLAGKPHKGGEIDVSSHEHKEITDETEKITVEWNNQTFAFTDLKEATDWHNKIFKTQ